MTAWLDRDEPVDGVVLFRTLLALWTIAYLLPRWPHIAELYCRPVLRSDLLAAVGLGPPPVIAVQALFVTAIAGCGALAVGWRPRWTWLMAGLSFALISGLDVIMVRAYGQLAVVQWLLLGFAPIDRKRGEVAPSWGTQLLKVQFCAVYVLSIPAKLAGTGWWDGSALLRTFRSPEFGDFVLSSIQLSPTQALALSWVTMATEVFIGVGLWFGRSRPFAIAAMIGMHGVMLLALRVSPLFHVLMWVHLVLFVRVKWPRS